MRGPPSEPNQLHARLASTLPPFLVVQLQAAGRRTLVARRSPTALRNKQFDEAQCAEVNAREKKEGRNANSEKQPPLLKRAGECQQRSSRKPIRADEDLKQSFSILDLLLPVLMTALRRKLLVWINRGSINSAFGLLLLAVARTPSAAARARGSVPVAAWRGSPLGS
jgi:hypothetical protein